MTEIILGQVQFVLVTAFWGMVLMAGYDILRFLRWLFPHSKGIIILEDILYWCIMAVPTYIVFFIFNEGEIRWYGVLAVLLGGILYEKGVGRPIRKFGYHHLTARKNRILHFCLRIGKKMVEKCRKLMKKSRKKDCKKTENGI